jgi:penicillin-binding protein 1A
MMNAMMRETLRIGTAQRAQLGNWPAAGKTGTSQDFRDAWFVGYTAHLVTGVWLGNDDSSPTRKMTGGGLPVEIWSRVMKVAHQGVAIAALPGTGMSIAMPFAMPFTMPLTMSSSPPAVSGGPVTAVTPGAPVPPAPIGARAAPAPQPPPPPAPTPPPQNGIDGWLVDRLFGRR